jgi:thiol-disulfide isomerase/thioredoxin
VILNRVSQRRVAIGLVAGLLTMSACGSGDDDSATPDTAAATEASDDSTAGAGDESTDDSADGEFPQQNGPVEVEGTPLTPFDGEASTDAAVGETAPIVSGESFDGSALTVGGASENPTMVVFLAHWCPHCNDEIPELVELEEAGSLPENLDVIGVSTAVDSAAPNYPPSEWVVEKNWPWPTMADDAELTAINAMGGTSFPFIMIVDADGSVLARKAGSSPADETLEFIDAALGA